jgi:hypothetical protein
MTSPLIEIVGIDDGEKILATISVAREDCRVAARARGLRMAPSHGWLLQLWLGG